MVNKFFWTLSRENLNIWSRTKIDKIVMKECFFFNFCRNKAEKRKKSGLNFAYKKKDEKRKKTGVTRQVC